MQKSQGQKGDGEVPRLLSRPTSSRSCPCARALPLRFARFPMERKVPSVIILITIAGVASHRKTEVTGSQTLFARCLCLGWCFVPSATTNISSHMCLCDGKRIQ